jgi:hypothetical protein
VVVVFGDFQHPFAWNGFASQNIFKERDHIIGPLWSAERDEDDGVKRR